MNHGALGADYVVDVDMVFQIDATTVQQCGISSVIFIDMHRFSVEKTQHFK